MAVPLQTIVSWGALLVALVALEFAVDLNPRVRMLEEDPWIIVPEMVQKTCVMEQTLQHTRGSFVLVSQKNPDHCSIANPGSHPKMILFGIMLDDATVAGAPALLLTPKTTPERGERP